MNVLIAINAATLITLIYSAVKVLRFFDKISFKVDLMWKDYEKRILTTQPAHTFNED